MKFMEAIPDESAYLISLTKKLAPPLGNTFRFNMNCSRKVVFLYFSDTVVCGA